VATPPGPQDGAALVPSGAVASSPLWPSPPVAAATATETTTVTAAEATTEAAGMAATEAAVEAAAVTSEAARENATASYPMAAEAVSMSTNRMRRHVEVMPIAVPTGPASSTSIEQIGSVIETVIGSVVGVIAIVWIVAGGGAATEQQGK
jgi:hypothetical protein